MVCVKKEFSDFVERVLETAEDCVFLKVSKSLLKSSTDVLTGFVYVAPELSVIYCNNSEGFDILENYMSQVMTIYPDLPWML